MRQSARQSRRRPPQPATIDRSRRYRPSPPSGNTRDPPVAVRPAPSSALDGASALQRRQRRFPPRDSAHGCRPRRAWRPTRQSAAEVRAAGCGRSTPSRIRAVTGDDNAIHSSVSSQIGIPVAYGRKVETSEGRSIGVRADLLAEKYAGCRWAIGRWDRRFQSFDQELSRLSGLERLWVCAELPRAASGNPPMRGSPAAGISGVRRSSVNSRRRKRVALPWRGRSSVFSLARPWWYRSSRALCAPSRLRRAPACSREPACRLTPSAAATRSGLTSKG